MLYKRHPSVLWHDEIFFTISSIINMTLPVWIITALPNSQLILP